MAFKIVSFDRHTHDCRDFDCGNPYLNRYLKEQAGQDMRRHYAALFVAVDDETGGITGFYTLSSTSIDLTSVPPEMQKRLPKYPKIPGIRIGRLAVSVSAQGRGVGTSLLADAAIRSMTNAAEWTVMEVDAKDDNAVNFYRKIGFCPLKDDPRHLFIMRSKLADFLKELREEK
jgi:ribosomal protein S18 acetylase RimI-like enzyme